MATVFACIAPHGTMLVPPIAGRDIDKGLATRAAMEELGRRMAAARPETVVVATPHGTTVEGAFSLLDTARVRGTMGRFQEWGGNDNAVGMDLAVDRELNAAIVEAARHLDAPALRIGFGLPGHPDYALALDYGAMVPLWSMGAAWHPQPRVVVACPDRATLLPAAYPRFGRAVGEAAEALGRRIAFIGSADLGHAHDPASRFGYDPASAEFDALVQRLIGEGTLGRLLEVDQGWLKRARTDAYGQLLNLHGLLEGRPFRGEQLSYEVPTYFGMLTAAYAPD